MLTTIGYGNAGVAEKGANFTHKLLLESGTFDKFETVRHEGVGFTSDQGSSESGVTDVGCRISCAADITKWGAMVKQILEGKLKLDPSEADCHFLLPNALYMPDHCHMIFGALEIGTKLCCKQFWSTMTEDLNALGLFLGNTALKMRFIATCLVSVVDIAVLNKHIGAHTDWKWEYLHQFLHSLSPVLVILLNTFDFDKVKKGRSSTCKLANEIDNKILASVRDILQRPMLPFNVEVAIKINTTH